MSKREFNILKFIPGFRSGKRWKSVIASIYYIIALLCAFSNIWLCIFLLSWPFIIFNLVTAIRGKNKNCLKISGIAFAAMLISPIIGGHQSTVGVNQSTEISNTQSPIPIQALSSTSIPSIESSPIISIIPTFEPTLTPTLKPTINIEEAERIAAEQAEAERIAAEQAEAERIAAEQAEAERIAAEQAEAERIAAEQAEAERIAAEQAEAERIAAEQAEAERIAAEQAEAERAAAEKAESERIAKEQKAKEQKAKEQKEKKVVEAENPSGETVWIGETGTKYHRKSCSTLRGNKYEITLKEAKAEGREPCKRCKP